MYKANGEKSNIPALLAYVFCLLSVLMILRQDLPLAIVLALLGWLMVYLQRRY